MRCKMRHKNTLILGGIVVAFLAIVMSTLISIKGTTKHTVEEMATEESEHTEKLQTEQTSIAVLKSIDAERGILTATDIKSESTITYFFTGGTKFISRYGQSLLAKELLLGEIIELSYDPAENKVVQCVVTDKAWEYTDIKNWSLDKEKKCILVGSKTFPYGTLFQAFNSKGMIDINALNEKDQVTVKGVDGQAYSVIVRKGHGTLQLSNYADFVGGTIEIGYDVMAKVEKDQELTVREGAYRVIVRKGSLEAVKYVHINADEQTTLDLGDVKKEKKFSKVKVSISPIDANFYINDAATEYASEIELEYGTYTIKATAKDYETYTAKVKIAKAKEEIQINLAPSNTAKATETPKLTSKPEATSQTHKVEAVTTMEPQLQTTPSPSATPVALKTDTEHTITVNGPSEVSLYLNGEFKGRLPVTFTKVIGMNMECTLKKEGQADRTYTMNVIDDKQNVTWQFAAWW